MGVITLFSMYYEGQIFMVAIERNAAGVVRETAPECFHKVDPNISSSSSSLGSGEFLESQVLIATFQSHVQAGVGVCL